MLCLDKIPIELKETSQWIIWRYVQRKNEKKLTKPPYSAKTLRSCDVTNPNSWCSFEVAVAVCQEHSFDGIDFVLANGYCGVDLDYCVNVETLEIDPHAKVVIETLNSYSEFSPSSTGLHVLVKATIKGAGLAPTINGKKYELFGSNPEGTPNKYFTVTGYHLEDTPQIVYERQDAFNQLYDWVKENSTRKQAKNKTCVAQVQKMRAKPNMLTFSDESILQLARKAKNGAKFEKLFAGDASDYLKPDGSPDLSAGDLALVDILCFYSNDDEQVARLWKASGFNRPKLLDRDDYAVLTIQTARASQIASFSDNFIDAVELTRLIEIPEEYKTITDDPKQQARLKLIAQNTALLLDAIRLLLLYLGFKKNHNRLLNALIRKGRERLCVYYAKQSWLLEQYVNNGEKISSEKTVSRDIQALLKEQQKLGVEVIRYWQGFEGVPSRFQNLFMRYALEAINDALNRRSEFEYFWQAIEVACFEVANRVPRNSILLSDEFKQKEKESEFKRARRTALTGYRSYLKKLLEDGRDNHEIASEAREIHSEALRYILEISERSLGGQTCLPNKTLIEGDFDTLNIGQGEVK